MSINVWNNKLGGDAMLFCILFESVLAIAGMHGQKLSLI